MLFWVNAGEHFTLHEMLTVPDDAIRDYFGYISIGEIDRFQVLVTYLAYLILKLMQAMLGFKYDVNELVKEPHDCEAIRISLNDAYSLVHYNYDFVRMR
ncbi:MAG: hypothetical protein LUB61_00685 [Eggerthellaceae bacterium]|nr:hypothetical protein [Eggerthellaceae bacterium]